MGTLTRIPDAGELQAMIGQARYVAWQRICETIDAAYDMECLWNDGGKRWTYEYKYRRCGKTLCALYAKPDCFGLMVIFGREERDKVETIREILAPEMMQAYDDATTYHDGKWVMFDENLPMPDLLALLRIKRRRNRK